MCGRYFKQTLICFGKCRRSCFCFASVLITDLAIVLVSADLIKTEINSEIQLSSQPNNISIQVRSKAIFRVIPNALYVWVESTEK